MADTEAARRQMDDAGRAESAKPGDRLQVTTTRRNVTLRAPLKIPN